MIFIFCQCKTITDIKTDKILLMNDFISMTKHKKIFYSVHKEYHKLKKEGWSIYVTASHSDNFLSSQLIIIASCVKPSTCPSFGNTLYSLGEVIKLYAANPPSTGQSSSNNAGV